MIEKLIILVSALPTFNRIELLSLSTVEMALQWNSSDVESSYIVTTTSHTGSTSLIRDVPCGSHRLTIKTTDFIQDGMAVILFSKRTSDGTEYKDKMASISISNCEYCSMGFWLRYTPCAI